jgi:predicted RNase H-like HicB family nuclease
MSRGQVSKWEKFWAKILSGQFDGNIDFAELVAYLRRCGFEQTSKGSHNLFTKMGSEHESSCNLRVPRRNAIKCGKSVIYLFRSRRPRRPAMSENKYDSIIYWDQADGIFVVEVPELAGCKAHGKTKREALESAEQTEALWLETARSQGREIPSPKGKLVFA